VVDHLVVGDAQNPREELAVIGITALVDHTDGFDESFLKNILGDIAVLDHHVDIVAHTAAVSLDKPRYGVPVTRKVVIKQYLVT